MNDFEDKIQIKRFKDGSNNFWVGFQHWTILKNELVFCAGGIPTEEHRAKLLTYCKRNKLL